MNNNAANALLKTLEEPPERVLFLLISHSAGRLLPTIRSRCMSIRFDRLSADTITQILEYVVLDKNALADRRLLEKAVAHCEGSARNAALSIVFGGVAINEEFKELIESEYLDFNRLSKLANILAPRDAAIQYQQFCSNFLDYIAGLALHEVDRTQFRTSKRWADLWHNMYCQQADIETYNLDKKQFIILAVESLHRALKADR